MAVDNSSTSDSSAEHTTARGDGPLKPAVFLEEDDGTRTLLSDESAPRKPKLPPTGLDNGDYALVLKSISQGTPSDAPTTVNDYGDTAQLEQQSETVDAELPRSSETDLAGIGRGVTDEVPNTDAALGMSDSESEDGKDLWTSIDDRLISPEPNDGKQFLPLDELRKTISRPNVRRALGKLRGISSQQVHEYVNKVCDRTQFGSAQRTTRQKMFAILVIIDYIKALPSLISEDLHDVHLPFECIREGGDKWHLFYKASDGTSARFQGSCRWKNPKVKAFVEKQWLVLSPFFNMQAGKPLFHPLESKIILPFIEGVEGKQTAWGGFSVVWRAKIHPAHHNYPHHTEPSFAIKKLKSHDKPAFERELHALNKFNLKGHPHVMTLLTTYEYHEHRHFVFPWADKNLREFWQHFTKPRADHSLVIWIAEQCAGIASGLQLIQHPPTDTSLTLEDRRDFGRHGDLKPENVLWFRDSNHDEDVPGGGILKIADFGLTRFHRDATKSGVNARNLSVSLTYKAPEVDVTVKVSPSYDIWTLGCLLLEFVTWYLKGWEGVDKFSANRATEEESHDIPLDTFYNLVVRDGTTVAVLKDSVRQWIQQLHEHSDCSLFLHSLLTYISHHLLRMQPKERHKCADVVNTLENMAKLCRRDCNYACRGCPKPPNKTDTNRTDNTVSDVGCYELENGGFAPSESCPASPELCTHGLPAEGEDFVVLDDLKDEGSNLESAHSHSHATKFADGLYGMEQPKVMTVNGVQKGTFGAETSPNSGEGRIISKRARAEDANDESTSETKRPRR